MRVLVTGAAGYIGSRLVPALEDPAGHDVTALDLGVYGTQRDFNVWQADIADLAPTDLEGFEAVINLAGVSTDPQAEMEPELTRHYNTEAAISLARAARDAGVRRFVQASTCSVYGRGGHGMREDSVCAVESTYGLSKLQAEAGIVELASGDFEVVVLRKGTVCGTSPRFRSDLLVNTMTVSAVVDGAIRVFDPEAIRPLLFIGDAVQAYTRALTAQPGLYNVAYPISYDIGSVAMIVALRIGQHLAEEIEIEYLGGTEVRSYGANTERMRDAWGWAPGASVVDMVDSVLAGLPLDVTSPRYKNIDGWLTWLEERGDGISAV